MGGIVIRCTVMRKLRLALLELRWRRPLVVLGRSHLARQRVGVV